MPLSLVYVVRQIECPQPADNKTNMMTDEEMVACFSNATVCVFAADYNEVSWAYSKLLSLLCHRLMLRSLSRVLSVVFPKDKVLES